MRIVEEHHYLTVWWMPRNCLFSLVEGDDGLAVWVYFSGFGLGPFVLVNNVNAKLYKDILDNYMFPTLWKHIGEDLFLFQHDCAPVHKVRPIKMS